jgi:limonene-1,2-epoxide hydrolase
MAVESVWEPRGISTIRGYQTAMTLLDTSSGPLNHLRLLIESEVAAYKNELVSSKAAQQLLPNTVVNRGGLPRLLCYYVQTDGNINEALAAGVLE